MRYYFALFILFSLLSSPANCVEGAKLTIGNNLALSDKKTSLRLCNEKNYKECERAGKIYLQEEDQSNAKKYFEIACSNKIGTSCYHLSTLKSIGSKETNKEFFDLLSKGCDYNDYFSCYQLGKFTGATSLQQANGSTLQVNFSNYAKTLLDKACKGKMVSACKFLESKFKAYPNQLTDEIADSCRAGIVEGCQAN